MNTFTKTIKSSIVLALLALAGLSGASLVYAQTQAPPLGNTNPPINDSSTSQVKTGGLSLGSLIVNGGSLFNSDITLSSSADLTLNSGSSFTQVFSTSQYVLKSTDGAGNFHQYYNTEGTTSPTRISAGFALNKEFNLGSGNYDFEYAVSGAAGSSISWLKGLTLRMDTGAVGIGTSAPTSGLRLDVEGNVGAALYCDEAALNCVDIATVVTAPATTTGTLGFWNEAGGNVYRTAGNVGIGTAAPTNAKLEITAAGDDAELLRFNTERAWRFMQDQTGASSQLELNTLAGGKVFKITSLDRTPVAEFATNDIDANQRVFLAPGGGAVGIAGTVSAGLNLDVSGKIGATEYCDENGTNCTLAGSLGANIWDQSGNNIYYANSGGNVSIGTSVATNYGLYINNKNTVTEDGVRVDLHPSNNAFTAYAGTAISHNLFTSGDEGYARLYNGGAQGAEIRGAGYATFTNSVRADGGFLVDGKGVINADGAVITTNYPNASPGRYGYFESRNNVGDRGFYLGWGNGGSQVDFRLDNATDLYISGGAVGIGVADALAPLHVSGDIRSSGNFITQGPTYSSTWMRSNEDQFGAELVLGAGGGTIIGGGEAAVTTAAELGNGLENLELVADGGVNIRTGLQAGWAGRIDAVTILADGDVGIGDTTPDTGLKLDVAGNVGAAQYCDENGADCITSAAIVAGVAGDNLGAGGSTPGTLYTSGGNLGQEAANRFSFQGDTTVFTRLGDAWEYTMSDTFFGPYVNAGNDLGNSSVRWGTLWGTSANFSNTVRADTGFNVDGRQVISDAGYIHNAQSDTDGRYGYFEGRRSDNTRGFYLGYGNGGSRVDLNLDAASQLYINDNVSIGTTGQYGRLTVAQGSGRVAIGTGTNTSGYTVELGANDDGVNFNAVTASRGFNFSNNNGRILTMNSAGNVGIGDSTPDAGLRLDISGNIGASAYCDTNGANCTSASTIAGAVDGDDLGDHTATQNLNLGGFRLNNSGSIAITNPSGTIGGTNVANGWLNLNNQLGLDGNEIYFQNTDGNIGSIGAYHLNLRSNGVTQLTLDPSGVMQTQVPFVMNGTTVASGLQLDVNGRVGATEYCDANGANCTAAGSIGGDDLGDGGSTTGNITINNSAPTISLNDTTTGEDGYFLHNSADRLYFLKNDGTGGWNTQRPLTLMNGLVGINTSNPSGYNLDVNGTARFTGAITGAGTGRFDGGVFVDGRQMISPDGYTHTARSTIESRYGYFEGTDDSGDRGFYLGWGNGGSRVDLILDVASQLYINDNVSIGTLAQNGGLTVAGGTAILRDGTPVFPGNLVSNSQGLYTYVDDSTAWFIHEQDEPAGTFATRFVLDDDTTGTPFFAVSNKSTPTADLITIASDGQVGIGDSTPETGLRLDVAGRVGATEYCDQNGANCTTAANIGGDNLGNHTLTQQLIAPTGFGIDFNHPTSGVASKAWEDNYLRYRFGGTGTPAGLRLDNYDTPAITLNRNGSADFAGNLNVRAGHIYLGAAGAQDLYGDNGSYLYFDSNNAVTAYFQLRRNDNTRLGSLYGYKSGTGQPRVGILDGDNNPAFLHYNDTYSRFYVNNQEVARFNANGSSTFYGRNGTGSATLSMYNTTGNAILQARSDAAANLDAHVQFHTSTDGTDNLYWSAGTDGSDGHKFKITSGSSADSTGRLTIERTGDVGIGDDTPDGTLKLDVEGAIGATQYCDQNGANCTTAAGIAAAAAGDDLGSHVATQNINLGSSDIITTNAAFPGIYLDSTNTGDGWTSQGAVISIGESASDLASTAAMNMTYRGDGTGYVGAGLVTNGVPQGSHLRFHYTNGTINTTSSFTTTSLGRFDGGVNVDGKQIISANGYQVNAQSTVEDRYGYLELRDNSGSRGAYFGYGNGGSRVDLTLDDAAQLYINDEVTIGTTAREGRLTVAGQSPNPASGIDSFAITTNGAFGGGIGLVDGTGNWGIYTDGSGANLRFSTGSSLGGLTQRISFFSTGGAQFTAPVIGVTPTASTHLTTKSYVDGLVGGSTNANYLRANASDDFTGGDLRIIRSTTNEIETAGDTSQFEIRQSNTAGDSYMTFLINGDYAVNFGLDGETNQLAVGGWSMGAAKYRLWTEANDGAGSGLDADLLDGQTGSFYQNGDNITDNTIDNSEIQDGTLTYTDTNVNSIQRRISGTCAAGSSIRAISNTGTVTCETDDSGGGADNLGNHTATADIQAIAGTAASPSLTFASDQDTGIYRDGTNRIGISTAGVERGSWDVSGLFLPGRVRADNGFEVDGTVVINSTGGVVGDQILDGTVDNSEIQDGTLTYTDTNVNSIQRRISGTCAAGSSIRAISNTGTVTCETDDSGGGADNLGNHIATTNITLGSNNVTGNTSSVVTAGSFIYASDKNLKTILGSFADRARDVLSIDTYEYLWKDSGESDFGVIAQEVEELFPELVYTNEAGTKGVDYAQLVVPLLEVTKQQQSEIDELRAMIEEIQKVK